MLSEKDRDRIKEEEIFRAEVVKALNKGAQAPATLPGKVWDYLNKPFVLWALSSIVVGLFSWAYATYQSNSVAKSQNEKKISMLDIEIAGRIEAGKTIIDSASDDDGSLMAVAVLNGTYDKEINLYNTFPEFKQRTTFSLLWELKTLVALDDRSKLRQALNGCKLLNRYFERHALQLGSDSGARSRISKAFLLNLINDSIELPRWNGLIEY